MQDSGFNIELGDVKFFKQVVITITNPAMENGMLVDHLIAPANNLLPSGWEVVGNLTYKLTMQSQGVSQATEDQIRSMLIDVQFISNAVRRHDVRMVTLVAFDLVRPGNTEEITIDVEPLNDPPTVTVESANPRFQEGGSPVLIYSQVNITDVDDDTLDNVKIVLTVNASTVSHQIDHTKLCNI